uniref:Uncharacterized protein n=1 Tax=Timema tahoe TaxID=61484 RepID=A0A7R9II70_9NEOP|nr:unnamed protein product [Timema tahoe]
MGTNLLLCSQVHLRGAGARLLNGNLAEYDGHQVQVQITPTDAPCDVMEENEETLFDGLMREVGMNGFFQKRFNVLFNLVLVVFATMSNLNLVFAMAVPGHWCYVPGREETNYTQTQWKQLTLPR